MAGGRCWRPRGASWNLTARRSAGSGAAKTASISIVSKAVEKISARKEQPLDPGGNGGGVGDEPIPSLNKNRGAKLKGEA